MQIEGIQKAESFTTLGRLLDFKNLAWRNLVFCFFDSVLKKLQRE